MQGFCVKCKKEREFVNPQEVKTKNNRYAIKGLCPVCGTTMYRFISKK